MRHKGVDMSRILYCSSVLVGGMVLGFTCRIALQFLQPKNSQVIF